MTQRLHGLSAVVALCALVSACGGGGDSTAPPPPPPPAPTPLPESFTVKADAHVDSGAEEQFGTSVTATEGVSFRWDFGDGTTATGPNPKHAYAKNGSYQVTVAIANTADDLRTASWILQVGDYAAVAGLSCTQPDSGGWCWQHAGAEGGHRINDIAFADARTAWAVGTGGALLKSVDGGDSWVAVSTPAATSATDFVQVRFYDTDHGAALTGQGAVLLTSDGGATWTRRSPGLAPNTWTQIEAFDAQQIVLTSSYYGPVFVSHDGGATWQQSSLSSPAVVSDGSDCTAVDGGYFDIAHGCTGGGYNSYPLPAGPGGSYYWASYYTVTFGAPQRGVAFATYYDYTAGGYHPWMAESADGGQTWSGFAPSGLDTLVGQMPYTPRLEMSSALDGHLYYAGYPQRAAATHDGGHTWHVVPQTTFLSAYAANYRDAGTVGSLLWESAGSRIATTADDGQTWRIMSVHAEDASSPATETALHLVHYADATTMIVRGGIDRFYITHDGGHAWQRILGPDQRDEGAYASASWFLDADHGFVATTNGALLATADGGRSWTRQDFPQTAFLGLYDASLWFSSTTDGWMVLNGTLSHTADGGATWSVPLGAARLTAVSGMAWADAQHGWVTTQPNYSGGFTPASLYATSDGGNTWASVTTLPPALSQYSGATGVVMRDATHGALDANGSIYTTSDGGASWQLSASALGLHLRGAGNMLWSWGNGLLYVSADAGITWQPASLPQGVTVADVAFADSGHGWVVGPQGTMLGTTDGGITWTSQPVGTDVDLTSVTALDASTAWVVTRNGQILATATGGR